MPTNDVATYDDAAVWYDDPYYDYDGNMLDSPALSSVVAIKSRATKVQDYLGIGTPGDRQ